jgi:hypothetical protein
LAEFRPRNILTIIGEAGWEKAEENQHWTTVSEEDSTVFKCRNQSINKDTVKEFDSYFLGAKKLSFWPERVGIALL